MVSKVEPEERAAEDADTALSEVPPELAPGKASKKEKKEKKDKKEKKKDKRAKKEKKEKSDPTTEAQPRESKRQAAPQAWRSTMGCLFAAHGVFPKARPTGCNCGCAA